MGLNTGISLEGLNEARKIIQDALPDEPLYGFTPSAGVPLGWPY